MECLSAFTGIRIPAVNIADRSYFRALKSSSEVAQHQIELVLRVGHALDAAVKKHGVYKLLRAARIPAQMAGLSELQGFLERGFHAFDALAGADEFLGQVAAREQEVSRRLFEAHPRPFDQLNSSSR